MKEKPKNVPLQRFACLLPVADSPHSLEWVPVSTLAADLTEAKMLAKDAGLNLIGRIDMEGNLLPP